MEVPQSAEPCCSLTPPCFPRIRDYGSPWSKGDGDHVHRAKRKVRVENEWGSWRGGRESALATVVEFAVGRSLQEIAGLLYQVEVKLLGRPSSAVPTKGPSVPPEEDSVPREGSPVPHEGAFGQESSKTPAPEGRCKAVLAVMNAMVDGSTPPTAIPFLTSLIQAAFTSLLKSGSLTTVGTPSLQSPPILSPSFSRLVERGRLRRGPLWIVLFSWLFDYKITIKTRASADRWKLCRSWWLLWHLWGQAAARRPQQMPC